MKARGGLRDSRRLNIPDAVLLGGNFLPGGQEGFLDYWAGDPIDPTLVIIFANITKKILSCNFLNSGADFIGLEASELARKIKPGLVSWTFPCRR
jgi:hypothetical protein